MPRMLVWGRDFRNRAVDLTVFKKIMKFPIKITPGPTIGPKVSIEAYSADELPEKINECLKLSTDDFVVVEGSFENARSL